MSIYTPPNKQQSIFNPRNFGSLGQGGEISKEYLNANYLAFPVAQGTITLVSTNVLGDINQTGDYITSGDITADDISGDVVSANTILIGTQNLLTEITTNSGKIKTINGSLETIGSDISQNTFDIGELKTQQGTNIGDISQNTFDIGELKTQQGTNTEDISQNTFDISTLRTQQGTNTEDISQNTFDIGELKTQQGTNTEDISQNTFDISTLRTQQGTNTEDISQNTFDISTLRIQQGTNTEDISQNTFDISTLQTQQGTNTEDISQNTFDISTLQTQQGTNIGDISQNTFDISTLRTQQGTNTEDISQNTFDIGELKTQQGTNVEDISQNTFDISTNTINISKKQDTLKTTSNIDTGTINSATITVRTNNKVNAPIVSASTSMDAPKITASSQLFYGTNNVATKISGLENTKQDKLIAGNNISIDASSNITLTEVVTDSDLTSALNTKQNTLTAGNNISIDASSNITLTEVVTDTDLTSALNTKQNTLNAGDNITIDASTNVISSTGGTTIDSTTDLSCNTLTTTGDATIGGTLTIGSETLDTKINNSINGKQNTITARNNLTITNDVLDVDENIVTNSLVIRPSILKANYTPATNGEIRATILTIDDYLNGVVYDVKDTLNSKQGEIDSSVDLTCKALNTFGDIIINESGGKTQNVGSLLTSLGSQQFTNTTQISTNSGNISTLQTNTTDLPTMRENISTNTTNILNKQNALSFNTNNIGIQSIVVSSSSVKGRNVAGQVLSDSLSTTGDATIGGILTIGSQTLDTKISNAINGKQNTITARNNLTITNDVLDVDEDVVTNSLVIRPSFLKESYTPSVAGEIRATTLTIDDYVNGVVYDVKDTLIGKQDKLENTSNLDIKSLNVLSDFGAIIVETAGQIACDILSSGTLSTNGNASIGGKLTASSGNIETFTAYTLNAFSCTLDTFNAQFINLVGNLDMTGTLTIGGETLDNKLSGKQDILTAGSGITIDASTNVISSTGGGGTTIDSTTDLSCNTLTTTGNVSIGGFIVAPNQPCFRAYPSESVVISSGSSFPSLPFDVIDIDNASGYNTSTYEYTIPVAGNWMFYWSCGVAAGKNFVTTVRKNNIIYDRSVLVSTQALRDFDTLTGKGISVISCAVGDVMNVTVNGGAQGASVAAGTGGNQFNSFGGFLIG